jgi:hypothetical protein
MTLPHRLTVELSFCAEDRIATMQEELAAWRQLVVEREEAYRVAKEGGADDTSCGCLPLEELTNMEAAKVQVQNWKKKLAGVGVIVPDEKTIAVPQAQMAQAQTTAVPTQIMATPPQPQLMAPALQPQVQARPGCA